MHLLHDIRICFLWSSKELVHQLPNSMMIVRREMNRVKLRLTNHAWWQGDAIVVSRNHKCTNIIFGITSITKKCGDDWLNCLSARWSATFPLSEEKDIGMSGLYQHQVPESKSMYVYIRGEMWGLSCAIGSYNGNLPCFSTDHLLYWDKGGRCGMKHTNG